MKNKNSYRLILENKKVFDFLINKIGLIRGKKENIAVPKFIFENDEFLAPFIRGLFDTDGNFKFSKQTKENNYYPRIRFEFYPTPLSLNLSKIFKKYGFNFHSRINKRTNNLCYEISGSKNLHRWMKIIGSSNQVYLSKYLLWKKIGYVPVKLSLNQRQKMLKETFIKP